ncbi:MAG TPA: transglycosylase SLT domain-containing protein [Nocardioides sp.]
MARLVATASAGALMFTLAPTLTSQAAAEEKLPPGRDLVPYTVKAGDTATGLAVKYHAWTRELISYNDLDGNGRLRVGQRIQIPVVTAAARKSRSGSSATSGTRETERAAPRTRSTSTAWQTRPSKAAVRNVIIRTARGHGVDPHLALAVSWQEAGWQMHHVSSANAIGAMQVLPGTGDWMEGYAGRTLDLRNVYDNVAAGVLLLKVLDQQTSSTTHQVAAYYQGLGAVRRHGIYRDSVRYVRNVKALQDRLESGWDPS